MKTIIHIIIKEFLQFKRDPKMFGIILVAPIVQLIILGYATNFDLKIVHTAIYDMDKSQQSRELLRKIEGTGYFSFDYFLNNYEELQSKIDNGKVILGFVIPRNFEKKINSKQPATLQAIFDGSDGNSASIAAGYINSIINNYSQKIILQLHNKSGKNLQLSSNILAETRVWYNPELKTRNFMIPGIVGLLLMIITLLLTSLAIVKEKEVGTLEQLIVTPIKSFQLIIGKLVPSTILGFIAVIVVFTGMNIIFNISIRGSIFFMFLSSFIYILSTLGLGMFVSTISKTQQQAMMLSIFVVMLPMVYLSGFAFPIENMPKIIQVITYVIPLRYFMVIIRGIILKGIGFSELWQETLILLLLGIIILSLSTLRFKKRLE